MTFVRHPRAPETDVLLCMEIGHESRAAEEGWLLYVSDLDASP